ncbi:unnamed protein product [Cuscuta campestris]|uniref:Uncharacterized protein n=1 Tax=Cuscuta campestris TaxID=132261 RepID=A0A484KZA4_9ASTE|nr:unnamed protein product [Cuscuta campestris]
MLSKVVLADTLNVDAEITATKGRTGAIKIQMDHLPKENENSNHHRLKLMKSQNQVASTKGKGKNVEANYADDINPILPKFDVFDFYMDDAEIGDEVTFGGTTTI